MVHLVDDHIVIIVFCELQTVQTITQGVLARKDMLVAGRFVVAIPHTAEVGIFEHNAESLHSLSQYLLPMSEEKEMTIGMLRTIAFEVEGCYHRLSCTRSSHHEIAVMPMYMAFDIQFLQNFLLIVFRTHQVKSREVEQRSIPVCP